MVCVYALSLFKQPHPACISHFLTFHLFSSRSLVAVYCFDLLAGLLGFSYINNNNWELFALCIKKVTPQYFTPNKITNQKKLCKLTFWKSLDRLTNSLQIMPLIFHINLKCFRLQKIHLDNKMHSKNFLSWEHQEENNTLKTFNYNPLKINKNWKENNLTLGIMDNGDS